MSRILSWPLGPDPINVRYARYYVVELTGVHDCIVPPVKHIHRVSHPLGEWIMAQFFDKKGEVIPLPGAGRAWWQKTGQVFIPVLNPDYYPIRVVIIG